MRGWWGVWPLLLFAASLEAATVSDVLRLSPTDLPHDGVVTGVVTHVFFWDRLGAVMADPADPDGPSVYVGGRLPGEPEAELIGAESLAPGDLVEVRGRLQSMLLEPGVSARVLTVLGRLSLPPPKPCRAREILDGRRNNRRVAAEGVFWDVRKTKAHEASVVTCRMGTPDGPLSMHVVADDGALAALRNRRVRIEGVSLPLCNARGEFLTAEISLASPTAIRPLDAVAPPVRAEPIPARRGVMAWQADGPDGYARRIVGEVVYADAYERFAVVRLESDEVDRPSLSVRVNARSDVRLPSVGECVAAEGFPVMAEDCGQFEEGVFVPLGNRSFPPPDALDEEELKRLLDGRNELDEEYNYRYVTLTARVEQASRLPDGRAVLDVRTESAGLRAILLESEGFAPEAYVDRPLVRLTGVIDLRLKRSYRGGLHMSAESAELLLMDARGCEILPDAAARRRRLRRYAQLSLQGAALPLVFSIGFFALFQWRRRELAATIARDRRRIADELHDSLAQQLSGARMMIFAVKSREDLDAETRANLSVAIDALESARGEVRAAVYRLKSDDFLMKPAETLLREDARKLTARGRFRVRTRLCPFPEWMSGDVKHDLLSIVHEAVTNADRHGHAKRIVILGERTSDGGLVLSVLNDGAPFDPAQALGVESGHFGLSSMRERAVRSGFALTFVSRGKWTEVRLERHGR